MDGCIMQHNILCSYVGICRSAMWILHLLFSAWCTPGLDQERHPEIPKILHQLSIRIQWDDRLTDPCARHGIVPDVPEGIDRRLWVPEFDDVRLMKTEQRFHRFLCHVRHRLLMHQRNQSVDQLQGTALDLMARLAWVLCHTHTTWLLHISTVKSIN